MKKTIAKILCFLIILGSVISIENKIMSLKNDEGVYMMTKFYELPENTVDVVVLGSSHAFEDINPAVLWDEYGISAYDLCGPVQPIWNSYFYLIEALKTQSPKAIVLEASMLINEDEYALDSVILRNTYGMKWSENKVEAIKVSAAKDDWLTYSLGYLQYHQRYKEVSSEDFKKNKGKVYYQDWKGYCAQYGTEPGEPISLEDITKCKKLSDKNEEYYRKIIELAKSENIPIYICISPYWGITKDDQLIYNEAERIAKEYEVDFKNYNNYSKEIGMDFERDCSDNAHLNYRGANTLTAAIGKDITALYEFVDHRGDDSYTTYLNNSEYNKAAMENRSMVETWDVPGLVEKMKNPSYKFVISIEGDCTTAEKNLEFFFSNFGLPMDKRQGIWFIDNSSAYGYSTGDDEGEEYIDLGGLTLLLKREGKDGTYENTIRYDKVSQKKVSNGVNVVVYDTRTETIVDRFGFDATKNYELVK